jgi:hypothetical protein
LALCGLTKEDALFFQSEGRFAAMTIRRFLRSTGQTIPQDPDERLNGRLLPEPYFPSYKVMEICVSLSSRRSIGVEPTEVTPKRPVAKMRLNRIVSKAIGIRSVKVESGIDQAKPWQYLVTSAWYVFKLAYLGGQWQFIHNSK